MHVVVTGASSGIGRDLAKVWAESGNRVSLVARRRALLDELKGELSCEAQSVEAALTDARRRGDWR